MRFIITCMLSVRLLLVGSNAEYFWRYLYYGLIERKMELEPLESTHLKRIALEPVVRVVIWHFGYFSVLLPFISFQKYPVHFHQILEKRLLHCRLKNM